MLTCIGTDHTARDIMSKYKWCITACPFDDQDCKDKCPDAVTPDCNQHPDSCNLLDSCADKCEPDTSTTSTPSTTQDNGPTYADVQPILAQACGSCHNGEFSTLSQVKAQRSALISQISSGRMPQGDSSWSTGADGQSVLDFLQNSPEVQ
jgi:hypothetical protein